MKLTDIEKRAVRYLDNCFPVTVEQFDEDHEPIGPQLRSQLIAKGAAWVDKPYFYRAPTESAWLRRNTPEETSE